MIVKVLSVASEAVPLVKTGGLADVVGALPAAVAAHGVEMTTLVPGYPAVMAAIGKVRKVHTYDALLGEPARLVSAKLGPHKLLVLDAPGYFDRGGGPYSDGNGADWGDNWRRFAALGKAAADLASGTVKGRSFDVLHAHDWQAAMAPTYLRYASTKKKPPLPSVLTIHNIAFQGGYDASIFAALGLPDAAFSVEGVEYHGGVSFLKGGISAASVVTTVSPSYAAEIRTSEFGMGLEGLIQSRGDNVRGILNGIDTDSWNPATDPLIAEGYTIRKLDKRTANKRALEAEFGLDEGDGPLFVVISRLTHQKGTDVLLEALDHLVGIGGRLALLGSGDPQTEAHLREAGARHPGKIAIRIGYDEALSHLMQAGGDAILVPSRFEPCGLTQLYACAYGCVPIVATTGGLADTIIDANPAAIAAGAATGIQVSRVEYHALANAVSRANALYYQPDVWRMMQRNGMNTDFSWAASGLAYANLYRELTGKK